MWKLVVFLSLTVVRCAEEYLSCLRTHAASNQQSPQLPQEVFKFFGDNFRKGVYVPPHLYIYTLTPGSQTWQQSREFCRNWGGDLAVYGMKTLKNRRKLIKNLPIDNHFWIGANDIAAEDDWMWVNGQPTNSSELIWFSGEPNDVAHTQNCVCVFANSVPLPSDGLAYDHTCSDTRLGLCEKYHSML